MVALAAVGFLFAWRARIYLGRLWSGSITRNEGHKVVETVRIDDGRTDNRVECPIVTMDAIVAV